MSQAAIIPVRGGVAPPPLPKLIELPSLPPSNGDLIWLPLWPPCFYTISGLFLDRHIIDVANLWGRRCHHGVN